MLVGIVFTVNVSLWSLPFFALFKQGCFIIAEQCDRTNIHIIIKYITTEHIFILSEWSAFELIIVRTIRGVFGLLSCIYEGAFREKN